jgi:hypothetical protein
MTVAAAPTQIHGKNYFPLLAQGWGTLKSHFPMQTKDLLFGFLFVCFTLSIHIPCPPPLLQGSS